MIRGFLNRLCSASGISGDETESAQKALEFLKVCCPDARISHGNVIGSFGSMEENAVHILLDAHIDQIGMVVTDITDDGFACVSNIGGIDRRLLPAQRVLLYGTRNGTQCINGVVCCMPPHLASGEESVLKWEDVRIDTGYSAAELRNILSPGDSVVFESFPAEMMQGESDRFMGGALDDRCGVAAILYAAHLLKNEPLSCKVTVMFSAQEEVGERGAKIGCFAVNPDIAIAVDVSFAGNGMNGTGIMGNGPMIGFSPTLSREVSRQLAKTAEQNAIPWQYEVMEGTTGTNADQFAVCREGARACTVSIPLAYMHTPAEVISLKDAEYTGRLLAAYIKEVSGC